MGHVDFSAGSYPQVLLTGGGGGTSKVLIDAGGSFLLIAGTDVLLWA